MHWPISELHQLSLLIVEIGDCFMVRRTLDRLEAEELTLQEAISGLEGFSNTPHQGVAYGTSWESSDPECLGMSWVTCHLAGIRTTPSP